MRNLLMLGTIVCSAAAQGATLELVGEAEKFMPGLVSREATELQASTNPLFPIVVFGCEGCPNQEDPDIYSTKRHRDAWSTPGRAPPSLPVLAESLPAFSSDGYWLYYVSNRRGGFGGLDLYRNYFSGHRQSFGTPENLGGSINSKGDEGGATADARGVTTYFASRGRDDAKGWDLYVSRRRAGKMTPGERLPTIDTRADEFDPALLANDAGLVFARAKKLGETRSTLWFAPREGEGFGKPVELGPAVNTPGVSVRGAQQDWAEPEYLLFTRDGDIWRIRYRIVP